MTMMFMKSSVLLALTAHVTNSPPAEARIWAPRTLKTDDDDECVGKVINGTNKAEVLIGTNCSDTIYGFGGDDTIYGLGGDDVIYGGGGSDVIFGGDGDDTIKGEWGDDTIYGGDGNDSIDGGKGSDILEGGSGDDTITGGGGADKIDGGSGHDEIDGGDGNDSIFAGTGDDKVDGGSGSDTIKGSFGKDTINGGQGSDVMHGGEGNDSITDTVGENTSNGGWDDDTVDAKGVVVNAGSNDCDIDESRWATNNCIINAAKPIDDSKNGGVFVCKNDGSTPKCIHPFKWTDYNNDGYECGTCNYPNQDWIDSCTVNAMRYLSGMGFQYCDLENGTAGVEVCKDNTVICIPETAWPEKKIEGYVCGNWC